MKLLTITTTLLAITAQTSQAIPTIEEVNKSYINYFDRHCTTFDLDPINVPELGDRSDYAMMWTQCYVVRKSYQICEANYRVGTLARKECLIRRNNNDLIFNVIVDN